MQRFDRYVLSQLLVLFGFFALVLVSVYWVNKAVLLFDQLLADGHAISIFLEFTALSLPSIVALVLPMSAFAASVYVTNRLSGDSELTVVQATGYSPWRLARPVFVFGLIVAVMIGILTHILVPKSVEQLRIRQAEIASSMSARLLREGVFLHPSKGTTVYIRDISPSGELHDIFLADRRAPELETIYTAERAYLVRDDTGPKLVMVSGMAQTLDVKSQRLSATFFDDLTHDISGLITKPKKSRRKLNVISTRELLFETEEIMEETGKSEAAVLEEAHARFEAPLLGLAAAMIGFSALLLGGFSRFGVGKQIVGAIFLLVVVKLVESGVADPTRTNPHLWPLVYLPGVVGMSMVAFMLWKADRPYPPRRVASPEVGQ